MSSSSGLGSPTIVGSPGADPAAGLLRLLQLVSPAWPSRWWPAWALDGAHGQLVHVHLVLLLLRVTLIILIVELGGLQVRFPLSWRNFPSPTPATPPFSASPPPSSTPTTYAVLVSRRSRDHAIAATAFSCIARSRLRHRGGLTPGPGPARSPATWPPGVPWPPSRC